MAAANFRGTSVDQDGRWGKAEEKLLVEMSKQGKFAPILDTKINIKKVNMDVMSKWITQKIIQLVGAEDEILINMVINLLKDTELDAKRMQVSLTAFLDKNTAKFVEELWTLLSDAQSQVSGIPSVLIERKKQEIMSRPSSISNSEIKTHRPQLNQSNGGSTTRETTNPRTSSPPGRLSGRLMPPPSNSPTGRIRSSIRSNEEGVDDKKRSESRSTRVHRSREQAPTEHTEDEGDRQRARSRRHGLVDERSQSTKKRHRDEELEKESTQDKDAQRRQRFPSRHHERRDRPTDSRRRSPSPSDKRDSRPAPRII
jgi:serine/arginine repetitive matrix protein 1